MSSSQTQHLSTNTQENTNTDIHTFYTGKSTKSHTHHAARPGTSENYVKTTHRRSVQYVIYIKSNMSKVVDFSCELEIVSVGHNKQCENMLQKNIG